MNQFQKTLSKLPELKKNLGQEKVDKLFVEFLVLSEELVTEMEGVRCPATAEAIINRLSSMTSEVNV